MRHVQLIFISLFATLCCICAEDKETGAPGIVEVMVTYQDPNPIVPWQRGQVGSRRGYGIILEGGTVLTAESLIRNAKLVEIRKAQSSVKIPAKVDISDPESNLGVISPKEPGSLGGLKPFELADKAGMKDKVAISQFDETAKLQSGEGEIILVSAGQESYVPVSVIKYKIQTDLGVNGIGCPVCIEGKLLGIVTGYGQKTVDVIGFPSISKFMDDFKSPPYEGFPVALFHGKLLLDPTTRKYLGVPPGNGLMVLGTPPFSPANGKLQANDVILAVDGHEIDNLGFYNDPKLGRILFNYIISGYKKVGDTSEFKILRDHKEVTVAITLTRHNDSIYYIPEENGTEDSEFLLTGGLLFRELSGRYLHSIGQRAGLANGIKLNHLYSTAKDNPPEPGKKIVIIQTVLPDDINIGYQNIMDHIVTAVNGKPVSSIKDIFVIQEKDGAITTVTLDGLGLDIVLDKSSVSAADKRIMRQFNIPKTHHRKPGKRRTP